MQEIALQDALDHERVLLRLLVDAPALEHQAREDLAFVQPVRLADQRAPQGLFLEIDQAVEAAKDVRLLDHTAHHRAAAAKAAPATSTVRSSSSSP